MRRLFPHSGRPAAQAPGTVEFSGVQKVDDVTVEVMDFDADHLEERVVTDTAECLAYRDTDTTTWINVNGLHYADFLKSLGAQNKLHPLVLEDIINVHQRPKMEDYGDYIYVVCRLLSLDESGSRLKSEQLSLIIGRNMVFTFQEHPSRILEPVRERLRRGLGRIRRSGPGYLGYAILDAVVDNYFDVIAGFGVLIEDLEDEMLDEPGDDSQQRIHHLSREMVQLRRVIWPMREVLADFERLDTPLLPDTIAPFLRDIAGHLAQVLDGVETFREVLSGAQDIYQSTVSNRLNDVMKVLTIFSTIFVPLTFIAGVYGMNFEHMPELPWKWSYLAIWIVFLAVAGGMLRFFRTKKWL